MKRYQQLLTLCLLSLIIFSCSSGTAEKPLPVSITSPDNLLNQGVIQHNNNDYARAVHSFKKALTQYRSIDNQTGIAMSCMNIAKSYMANNHNDKAKQYLNKASSIINQASLKELKDHLHLLESSLAIKNSLYTQAIENLKSPLLSNNTNINLAALKNRTIIAFSQKDNDKTSWLDKYKTQQSNNPQQSASHLARILRFEAELASEYSKKINLLNQSLVISRKLASRTAIAANLSQWANADIQKKIFDEAEDKLLRALFIRHQIGDTENSLSLLKQLNAIYMETGNNKHVRTQTWIDKLSQNKPIDWNQLFSEFDTYPESH